MPSRLLSCSCVGAVMSMFVVVSLLFAAIFPYFMRVRSIVGWIIVVGNHSEDVAATLTSLGLASPARSSTPSLLSGFWFLPPFLPGHLLV